MPYVIRLIRWTDGREFDGEETNAADRFIHSVDIQKGPSKEWLTVTSNPQMAKQWATHEDALAAYHETLLIEPIRPDGRPNRPLMALKIVIEELVQEEAS